MRAHSIVVMIYFALVLVVCLSHVGCGDNWFFNSHDDNMSQFDRFDELVPDSCGVDTTNGGM